MVATATSPEMIGLAQSVLEDLDLHEVVEVEQASGVTIAAAQSGAPVSFNFVVAIVWVLKRRSDPEFTFADAGKLKLRDLKTILAPTPAAPLTPLNGGKAPRGNTSKSNPRS